MTIETATYLHSAAEAYPQTADQVAEGDDHIRLLKNILKATFPGRGGADHRTIIKAANFTPASTEISAVYICTAALTVLLPALGGVSLGAHYTLKAVGGIVTLTPNGTDTIDLTTMSPGEWGILVRGTTSWYLLKTQMGVTSVNGLTGDVVVTGITWGTLPGKPTGPNITGNWVWTGQQNMTYLWGSNDGVNHYPVDRASLSVGYAAEAGSAAALTGGYTPASFATAGHSHTIQSTAVTAATTFNIGTTGGPMNTGYYGLRFTRANLTTFDVNWGYYDGGGSG